MSVNFVVRHRRTDLCDLHIVTGAHGWETAWLPAARELGLELVPYLGNGSFVNFPPEDIPNLMEELTRLRPWMEAHGYVQDAGNIEEILRVLAEADPTEYSYGFG